MTRVWRVRGVVLLALCAAACQPPARTPPPKAPADRPDGPRAEGVPPYPADTPLVAGEVKPGQDVTVVFHWPLYVVRTGKPARETLVGYARADGSPGGVVLVNGTGAVIQPIPGAEGPDAQAVAARWLKARGWAVRR